MYYYQNDHLGTPQRMVNASGDVVWEARYSAFGETEIISEAVTNNLRFPGQYFDSETGLHHNYFRDYDAGVGRYVQGGPIGLLGGVNVYVYAFNSPYFYMDPYGLICLGPVMIAAISGAAGGAINGFVTAGPKGAVVGLALGGLSSGAAAAANNATAASVATGGVAGALGGMSQGGRGAIAGAIGGAAGSVPGSGDLGAAGPGALGGFLGGFFSPTKGRTRGTQAISQAVNVGKGTFGGFLGGLVQSGLSNFLESLCDKGDACSRPSTW